MSYKLWKKQASVKKLFVQFIFIFVWSKILYILVQCAKKVCLCSLATIWNFLGKNVSHSRLNSASTTSATHWPTWMIGWGMSMCQRASWRLWIKHTSGSEIEIKQIKWLCKDNTIFQWAVWCYPDHWCLELPSSALLCANGWCHSSRECCHSEAIRDGTKHSNVDKPIGDKVCCWFIQQMAKTTYYTLFFTDTWTRASSKLWREAFKRLKHF